jgi:hypothetical protein
MVNLIDPIRSQTSHEANIRRDLGARGPQAGQRKLHVNRRALENALETAILLVRRNTFIRVP